MSVIFTPCMDCKHLFDTPHKEGVFYCDAFTEGIPKYFLFKTDEKFQECKKGIKYDPID